MRRCYGVFHTTLSVRCPLPNDDSVRFGRTTRGANGCVRSWINAANRFAARNANHSTCNRLLTLDQFSRSDEAAGFTSGLKKALANVPKPANVDEEPVADNVKTDKKAARKTTDKAKDEQKKAKKQEKEIKD